MCSHSVRLEEAEDTDATHSLYRTPFDTQFKGDAVHCKLFLDFNTLSSLYLIYSYIKERQLI